MYTEERVDEGAWTGGVGRASNSSTAGEMLRVDGAVWKDDAVETESVRFSVLLFLVEGVWLVDGRRDSSSTGGEVERLVGMDERRLEGVTFIDSRWAASLRSWLMAEMGRFATDAERCCIGGRSVVGDLQSSSTTFGRPTKAYETMTAMSQLLPLSHLEMDMVRALHSLTASWMTTSS